MSNEVSQRYIDGFTSKCAEYNVDPAALVKYSQATEETEETDTDKYYKRRRRMAVLLPTILSAVYGASVGGMSGAVIGAGTGYGLGAAARALRDYMGADPMLDIARK